MTKKLFKATIPCLVAFLCALLSPRLMAEEIFVQPTGSDRNPGTLQKPFATLQRAQQAARKIAGRQPVTVSLRGGTYYLPETLIFTAKDSGTAKNPVVYRAYRDEKPVISGGSRLNLKWEPYQGGIFQA
ncbi:signaling protein, partial [bacterium]